MPRGLSTTDSGLNDEQKKQLHNTLRTNRYGIFGKEKNEKTIAKLNALYKEVNLQMKWEKNISRSNEGGKPEEKTVVKTNNGSTQPSSDPGCFSESLERDSGNVVHEKVERLAKNQKNPSTLNEALENL